MSLKRLSLAAAQSLIKRYETEMTALKFQAGEIAGVLKDLKKHEATLQKAADKKAAIARKKAGAVAKKKAAAAAKKAKAAAKKKAAADKKKAAAAAKRAKAAAKRAAAAAKKKAKAGTKKKAGRPAKKKATRTTARKKAGRPAKRKAGRPAAKRKAGRPAKRKAGRPASKKKSVKKVTARRKSTSGKRGRKMSYSDWDMLVLNTLKGKSSPTRTADLLSKGTSFAKGNKMKADEKSVRAKVAASLQKLVNKTKEVKKVSAKGRGFAYKMS